LLKAPENRGGPPGTPLAPFINGFASVPDFRQEGAMRVHAIGVLAVGALLTLSCGGSIRPVAIHEGDQCFRCRRPIVEKATAAELIDGTLASKFRAPGCMAKYLVDHPGETGTTFVTDFATGKWLSPDQATFVPVVVNPNTGESDYHAFLNKADADAAAAVSHTVPINWKTVLEKARS
jgi:hypothetical protein